MPRMERAGYAFGPFRLEVRAKRLTRDGALVALSNREFAVLHVLVSRAGEVVSKGVLAEAGWPGEAITDDSLFQVISRIRRALDAASANSYITNAHGRGYSFAGPVAPVEVGEHEVDLDALLSPYRALRSGRAAIETLERSSIETARATFERVLAQHDDEAGAHVGMANACAFRFESTRADAAPDVESLQLAERHARRACHLAPELADAWATLGFVFERTGDHANAVAALRRAMSLEPYNFHHHLRLAFVSWGQEALIAARRVLDEVPCCLPARWLVARVYVARDQLDKAERELDLGLAHAGRDVGFGLQFSAVGLNWLKGLLCLARGADGEAKAFLQAELAFEPLGHLYGRETAANTRYATGALRFRQGDKTGAQEAFEQAIARVPAHPMAHAGLGLLAPGGEVKAATTPSNPADAAMARAVALVAAGDAAGAAQLVEAALRSAPAGNSGWLVPIEPMLNIQRDRAAWVSALRLLRVRAA